MTWRVKTWVVFARGRIAGAQAGVQTDVQVCGCAGALADVQAGMQMGALAGPQKQLS